ncbi:hypothetical protein Pmani_002695 [Petrolisthes manimaculis]|uniref:Uncharacterized protein n=1 Tax=Petrolisthes manimaculis TaxID=1843537 RepID=A0AAE1UJ56_9EUCA|nr:hypothetical protein Pmani_002695 [Petrolisthes manimaculis]
MVEEGRREAVQAVEGGGERVEVVMVVGRTGKEGVVVQGNKDADKSVERRRRRRRRGRSRDQYGNKADSGDGRMRLCRSGKDHEGDRRLEWE